MSNGSGAIVELVKANVAGREIVTGQLRRSRSPWGAQTGSVYAVLCSDGKVRHATVTAEADSFWTLPARVSVRGKTVTGYLYVDEWPNGYGAEHVGDSRVYKFTPNGWMRNARMLPEWPPTAPPTVSAELSAAMDAEIAEIYGQPAGKGN